MAGLAVEPTRANIYSAEMSCASSLGLYALIIVVVAVGGLSARYRTVG